jgi:hypothetical protein
MAWSLVGLAMIGCGGKEEPPGGLGAAPPDATAATNGVVPGADSGTMAERAQVPPALDVYCAMEHCVRDWSMAEKPETWCSGFMNAFLLRDCMGYEIAVQGGADYAIAYIYAQSDGLLVAVAQFGPTLSLSAGELPFSDISACIDRMPLRDNLCAPIEDASSE